MTMSMTVTERRQEIKKLRVSIGDLTAAMAYFLQKGNSEIAHRLQIEINTLDSVIFQHRCILEDKGRAISQAASILLSNLDLAGDHSMRNALETRLQSIKTLAEDLRAR